MSTPDLYLSLMEDARQLDQQAQQAEEEARQATSRAQQQRGAAAYARSLAENLQAQQKAQKAGPEKIEPEEEEATE